MTMPTLETPQKPAETCPALSPAKRALHVHGAAILQGALNAAEKACSESTPAEQVGHEQLAGPLRPAQQAGGRKFGQRRLELQQARPVSLNSPGAAQRPVATDCDGLHAAILTHLELQDEEVCSTLFPKHEKSGDAVALHSVSVLKGNTSRWVLQRRQDGSAGLNRVGN